MSVSAAQSIFTNQMLAKLGVYVPQVNPAAVIATGATDLQQTFAPEEFRGIQHAYMDGLRAAWALSIALAGLAFVSALPLKFRKLSGKSA